MHNALSTKVNIRDESKLKPDKLNCLVDFDSTHQLPMSGGL